MTLETGASSPLGFGADPAWGPDGLLVYACAKELGENTTLCTLDADQPGETQPEIASDATRPAPAPDGSRVAFHRGATDVGETWLVEADGSNLRRLAAGSYLEWSPDGAWLAGQPESATYQVAIVRADGMGLTVLAPGYGPAWSPSGARIAYSLVEDETASIRVVDVASGEVAIRYSAPAGVELSGPAWLADGALVFVQAGDLWRLPADSDVPTRITTDLGLDPSGDPLSVSPDGRWTAFTLGSGADARVGIASVDGTVRMLDLGTGPVSQPAWGPPPAGQASAQIGHSWASGVAPVVVDRPLGRIEAATAGGPGFVAVGRGCQAVTGTERCEGIVWTSADGRTWVRAPASDATDIGAVFPTSGPEVGMFDVAAGSPGVVAIGYAARPDIQPTAWFSADGFTWRRIPLGAANSYRVHAVAWSGERFVIVGEDRTAGPTSASEIRTTPARAAVWTSTDGIAWARVPHTAAFDIGGYIDTMEDPASGGISDVAGWSGGLVAVGSVCEAASMTCRPAAWTSPDGTSWARIADVPAVPGLLKAVAASGSSLVAVGAETCGSSPVAIPGDCPPLVLVSADGRSWTQASWPFTQSGDLRTVTRIGDAFFATAPDGPATLWTSADGATWAPAELAGGPATAGEGLFAEWHFAVSGDVAVWLGTPTTAGDPAAWLSVSAP